jgi:aryl-alcohol dehydrogenase-like predicted oxidoreductase
MRTIALGNEGMRSSVLGFGCSAVLGRVGRKDSLAALSAAFEAGITFFDTARSYGYGESEALLGEFLQGRRASVVISTKFGILPAKNNILKQSLKPLARKLLQLMPSVREVMQGQIAAQFSEGHFSVAALRESLETSLRALRTDYVDLLFMHEAPVNVLQQDDLFAALERLVAEGKIRRYGIASHPPVVLVNLAEAFKTIQFPCNLFELGLARMPAAVGSDVVTIANNPFGGGQRISESKALLTSLSRDRSAPAELREKLRVVDDVVLADAVLNAVTRNTSIQVVIPSMMQLDHLRANVVAIEHSRFSSEELYWLRNAIGGNTHQQLM